MLPVATTPLSGSESKFHGSIETSASSTGARASTAAVSVPSANSLGKSFALCTARSTSPASSARSSSAVNKPLRPARSTMSRVFCSSPEVRTIFVSIFRSAQHARKPSATMRVCCCPNSLPRVPSTIVVRRTRSIDSPVAAVSDRRKYPRQFPGTTRRSWHLLVRTPRLFPFTSATSSLLVRLLLVGGQLRRRLFRFQLRTHLPDERSLLFELASQRLNLFLLLLNLLVLFQEFIQQHHIHGIVADSIDLALIIAHHQIRIDLGHVLGDQAKLRCARVVLLVVESHRLKGQDRVARLLHRFNVLFEPRRGSGRAELPGIGDDHWQGRGALRRYAVDVADPTRIAHIRSGVADRNNTAAGGDFIAGSDANRNVGTAAYVAIGIAADRKSTRLNSS